MSMNDMMRKMAVFLEKKQNALFSFDVDLQRKYIEKLGNPKDDIERSYFQYRCQMKFNGKVITFLLNFVSFPMALIYLLKYGARVQVNQLEHKELVFFRDGKPENILPNSLAERYKTIQSDPIEGIVLTQSDKTFIKNIIRRYPFSWQFILKCLIKIGRYSFVIKEYTPKAIVVCAEYSFTSSVLTAYCKLKRVKHIDIMHGEKLYYMRDSFFKFDECYIWDEYYKKILTSMKADKNQFIVEIPASLKFDKKIVRTNLYDYTYYLGAESEDVLKKISEILKQLYMHGKKVSIRPHPRYTSMEVVRKIFSFINIEDTKEVSIVQSLLQTRAAISLYSTVLNQASHNLIPIIIDDISNPNNFNKLKELGYVCLNREHKLLSDLMEETV